MKSSRFYKIIILILVLLNVSIIGFFWWNKPPGRGAPISIVKIVSYNKDVAAKITKLEIQHHIQKRKLMGQSRELHEEFYADMSRTEDEELIYLQKIGAIQIEIDKITYDFFQGIMNLSTAEQKIELKKFIDKAIQQFDGPKHPR